MGVVVCLGVPVLAVFIFEILLNACALFNHETNTNYGFSVIWWDKIFRSYTDEPDGELTLGLSEYQTDAPSGLWWSLIAPFRRN